MLGLTVQSTVKPSMVF